MASWNRLPTPAATAADPSASSRRPLSRRSLLGGVAGLAALGGIAACTTSETFDPQVAADIGGDDQLPLDPAPEIPDDPPVVTGSFVSQRMAGRPTRWAASRPNGVTGELPVVIVAHALNTNERSIFGTALNIQGVVQQYVDAGNPPFAVASVDVGRNYFHARSDGADGAAMILDEFIPMLENSIDLNLRTDRIGLYGWSMGGYGALRIGALLGSPRVAAIAASSPALWGDPNNFPPRAFDSYADYQANSLFGQQHAFSKIPVLLSIGMADQFYTYTRQWAADLHPPAAFSTTPGGHTNRFWRSVLPEQIEFLGRNLAR
ncbi:alpha/beta hydrolase-fold protein [Gordonia hydrophobica]|uniref:Acyl-CoA:diacylglycerol acyltransferase n=1 Tax=Gordonia hydrophobica TaxID=40516 RepID=A0ABZ2U449_9ACTN|nr:alpha/beta hydrolase-fold protein [Gordonia hydrophobica]MBM7367949.1 S-formylglutathione hydrolase FrmB [Gordonia hydrophobica]